jgi:uncharacterized RDD family membrane protein YckC
MDRENAQFPCQSVDQVLSALEDIRPLSCPPAKQQFKAALTGWSGRVLAFQVVMLVIWLILESVVITFFPPSALAPIITLFFLILGMAYFVYVVIAEIREWKNRESLVHASRIEERKHNSSDMDKLLTCSSDSGLLKETRIEINAELEKLRNESSAFTGSIKEVASLLLAVVAILAILTSQRTENLAIYPMALALGSLAVILGFLLRFPVYRRIRLYSYWSYILERAIHHLAETALRPWL